MLNDVYMHGQILGTHSFLLRDGFLIPDEYSEISDKYFLPGGETGTAATVLASLGVSVKIDGTHIGTEVAGMLRKFYEDKKVDLSSLYFDSEYDGLMDYVLISGNVRTPMGMFQSLYESGVTRWNMPKEEDIASCRVAAIDPFFMEATMEAAKLCIKHNKPYVTIDCCHDDFLHENCAINVVSKECYNEHYKGMDLESLCELMKETTGGLVIITCGDGDMIYGRKNQQIRRMKPFKVDVKSTLGAGDTFKSGCVYGLLKGMGDDEIVRFASACSAVAITRFPLPLNPPKLYEVNALIG